MRGGLGSVGSGRKSEEPSPSRRGLLGGLGAVLAGATAGCSSAIAGTTPPETRTDRIGTRSANDPGDSSRFPSICDGEVKRGSGLLARRLIPLGDEEYDGPDLLFQSFAARRLLRHASWYRLIEPYLARLTMAHDRVNFELARADRVTALVPRESHFPGYVHYATDFSKRRIMLGFQSGAGSMDGGCRDYSKCVRIREVPDYRGYTVKATPRGALHRLAYDDDSFIVVPDPTSGAGAGSTGWAISGPRRLRRLIDLEHRDLVPYHCVRPELAPLAARIETPDFLHVRLQMRGETFDASDAPPSGARAHALAVSFQHDPENGSRSGPPEARNMVADLGYYAVFPEATAERARATAEYVERLNAAAGPSFGDTTVEYGGTLAWTHARRPLATQFES